MKTSIVTGISVRALLICSLFQALSSCQKEMQQDKFQASDITEVQRNDRALAHAKQYSSDVPNAWFDLLTEISRTKPYFSGQAVRIFGYSSVALYEAVVPGMPSYQSIYKHLTGNIIEIDNKADYYWPACANAALARISSKMMQAYPAPDVSQVDALEASIAATFPATLNAEVLKNSKLFGQRVGDIIFAWSMTDGTFNTAGMQIPCAPYVLRGTQGSWVPTAPAFLPAAGQCTQNVRTFYPNIANITLAPPHPAYSTDPTSMFYQAANEVYVRNASMTAYEKRAFSNWRDLAPNYNPLAHMLRISVDMFQHENVNLEDAAVLYAKENMAALDAVTAVFKSKYHYALIRPITYIRGVMGFSTWLPFGTTPQTPSYPDELGATAASVTVLEKYFGTNYPVIDSVHQATHGIFSYSALQDIPQDEVEARVSGGTTFRFGGNAGIVMGRQIGELIDGLPFKKP